VQGAVAVQDSATAQTQELVEAEVVPQSLVELLMQKVWVQL
tara:strand:+ start:116 stop:238 length:123 start_codon:yes stop_codon:yes gene_type:complete